MRNTGIKIGHCFKGRKIQTSVPSNTDFTLEKKKNICIYLIMI